MNLLSRFLFLGALATLAVAQTRESRHEVITATVNDCERSTNAFVGSLRQALNEAKVPYDRKDDILKSARDLENAMDNSGKAWNRDKDREKTAEFVRQAIESGNEINKIMMRRRLNKDTERQWTQVRRQLNLLGKAFGLAGI
jgi:hypothetical protein